MKQVRACIRATVDYFERAVTHHGSFKVVRLAVLDYVCDNEDGEGESNCLD